MTSTTRTKLAVIREATLLSRLLRRLRRRATPHSLHRGTARVYGDQEMRGGLWEGVIGGAGPTPTKTAGRDGGGAKGERSGSATVVLDAARKRLAPTGTPPSSRTPTSVLLSEEAQ